MTGNSVCIKAVNKNDGCSVYHISSDKESSFPTPPSHSLQSPIQLRCRHLPLDGAVIVGVLPDCVEVGALVIKGGVVVLGKKLDIGLVSSSSQQPQNLPGVSQVVVAEGIVVDNSDVVVASTVVVVVLSLQPNQPGVRQVEVEWDEAVVVVVVALTETRVVV